MKNPTQPPIALIMSEQEWSKNKEWLLQFPGIFCNPVIEQMERYLMPLPTPDPSALGTKKNKSGVEPDSSSDNQTA